MIAMNKPKYTFLLIDDLKANMGSTIDAGKQRGILVLAVDNVEDGIARLKADPNKYDAVILDAKCKLKASDTADSYNEAALRTALRELDDLDGRTGRPLPRCVYTAYSDAAENNQMTEKVFMKGGPGTEGKLFDYLRGEVNLRPTRAIEKEYASSLELCNDDYLPAAKRAALLELLGKMASTNATEIEQFMQVVRKFLEEMYKRMNAFDKAWMPDVLFNRGNPILTWCSIYMSGKNVEDSRTESRTKITVCAGLSGVPTHVAQSIRFLTDTTHATSHSGTYQPSQHALRSLVFALLEVLQWFKTEVDTRTI
jgi:hypothetical protein